MEGKDIKPLRLQAALAVYNKVVPALTAMSVQVEQVASLKFHDINSLLMTSGVNPAELFDSLDSSITPEKVIAADVALDPPTPDK
jgi:hypothetical protein